MGGRIRSVDQAGHVGRRLVRELGDELREARLRAGLRQIDVARALGVSQGSISAIELGQVEGVGILDLARQAGAVGLRLSARMYPAGAPIRDQAQVALLDRFRRRLAAAWQVRIEVPLPGDRDLRAWDMVIERAGVTVRIEAITRLRDVQAQVRAAQLKRRDAGATRLVLLIAATHANRRALAAVEPLLRSEFQLGTRAALAALAAGHDPGADALILT